MSAMDRDALSGYGVIVHIMFESFITLSHALSEADKVTTRTVKTRMD